MCESLSAAGFRRCEKAPALVGRASPGVPDTTDAYDVRRWPRSVGTRGVGVPPVDESPAKCWKGFVMVQEKAPTRSKARTAREGDDEERGQSGTCRVKRWCFCCCCCCSGALLLWWSRTRAAPLAQEGSGSGTNGELYRLDIYRPKRPARCCVRSVCRSVVGRLAKVTSRRTRWHKV